MISVNYKSNLAFEAYLINGVFVLRNEFIPMLASPTEEGYEIIDWDRNPRLFGGFNWTMKYYANDQQHTMTETTSTTVNCYMGDNVYSGYNYPLDTLTIDSNIAYDKLVKVTVNAPVSPSGSSIAWNIKDAVKFGWIKCIDSDGNIVVFDEYIPEPPAEPQPQFTMYVEGGSGNNSWFSEGQKHLFWPWQDER